MNREELIQRKAETQAEIARLRRQLAAAQDQRRRAELEAQLQALMAEEHRLRLLIDRTR